MCRLLFWFLMIVLIDFFSWKKNKKKRNDNEQQMLLFGIKLKFVVEMVCVDTINLYCLYWKMTFFLKYFQGTFFFLWHLTLLALFFFYSRLRRLSYYVWQKNMMMMKRKPSRIPLSLSLYISIYPKYNRNNWSLKE